MNYLELGGGSSMKIKSKNKARKIGTKRKSPKSNVDKHSYVGHQPVLHCPEGTMKSNAAFLIESSEKIDYDSDILSKMKEAYEREDYDDVIDLAYLHDRNKRGYIGSKKHTENEEESFCELVEEVIGKGSAINCCRNALEHLCGDLTYDNRAAAKAELTKAIELLSLGR